MTTARTTADGDARRLRAYPLLFGPSPIHRLDRLTKHLGGATVWAKRAQLGARLRREQDGSSSTSLADALAQSCDTLVSMGGVSPSHTARIAARGRSRASSGPARPGVGWPGVTYGRVGNILSAG